MTPQTAVDRIMDDATTGGWTYKVDPEDADLGLDPFLDPKFWQAVGRTRVWGHGRERLNWKNNWLAFIQYLADGKDIEEALKSIE